MIHLLCLLAGLAATAERPASGSVPIPGGIADAQGKIGYVVGRTPGVKAVDLQTGKVLWETSAAKRPLLVADGKLIAQAAAKDAANGLAIVVFDAVRGKPLLQSERVALPGWAAVDNRWGRSFRMAPRIEAGKLLVPWHAKAWYAGGAAPTRQREEADRKEASGVARIDLATGKVETLDEKPGPLASPAETREAVVAGRKLILISGRRTGPIATIPRTLRAIDAATGKTLWEQELEPERISAPPP